MIDNISIIVYKDQKRHYKGSLIHNENGPAIEYNDGCVEYYRNGQLHNTEGPAVIRADGSEHYYLEGKYYSKEDFLFKKTQKFAIILMRTGMMPKDKNVLIKQFEKLYYRTPTNLELASIKMDMMNENVIMLM